MTVEIKDILLKAAEDVQQGMWCRSAWFASEIDADRTATSEGIAAFQLTAALDEGADSVRGAYRCAEGSIQLATVLLGGDRADFETAVQMVGHNMPEGHSNESLAGHNDSCLPDDPFESGQQLAELFRTTAEAL